MRPPSGPFNPEQLQVAMMGHGSPKCHLTPLRKCLLRALLDAPPHGTLARTFELPLPKLEAELRALEQVGLVAHSAAGYRPTFLVVAAEEVAAVVARAQRSASAQAALLTARWPELHRALRELKVGEWDLPELAFFLVGNWLLDQSLLAALAHAGTLMPPPPQRPLEGEPDARYYLWLVEGAREDLGHYGQRAHALPWANWYLVTFGEYTLAGRENGARMALEERGVILARQGGADTPGTLAGALSVPAFSGEVTVAWLERVYPLAEALVGLYNAERVALERLYGGLRASRYLPDGLSEFMCWYDHLVFARTIDLLVVEGQVALPSARFAAAIWQDPGVP